MWQNLCVRTAEKPIARKTYFRPKPAIALYLIVWLLGCNNLTKSDFLDAQMEDGQVSWVTQIGGPGVDGVSAIDTHQGGDIAIAGTLSEGEIDFQVGQSTGGDTATVNETMALFYARYSPAGSLVWAELGVGDNDDYAHDIVANPDGSTLIAGQFYMSLIFDEGEPTEITLGDATGTSAYTAFTANFASDGSISWARQVHGESGTHMGLTVDTSTGSGERVHWFAGKFKGEAIFGFEEAWETTLTSDTGGSSMFLAAYNEDGSLRLAKQSLGAASGEEMVAMDDGSVVVIGSFEGDVTLGHNESVEISLEPVGSQDVFMARYLVDGTLSWARSAGSLNVDEGKAITQLTDGSILVAGTFEGTMTLGSGESLETTLASSGKRDVFFAKYAAADGSLVWARSLGGPSLEDLGAVDFLPGGGFVLAGSFIGTARFGSLSDVDIYLDSRGGTDIFVAGFDANGNLTYARGEGGLGNDEALAVTAPTSSSTMVAGKFDSEVTFGMGDPGETTVVAGDKDGFILRLDF